MRDPLDLETLLPALRAAGLAVGVTEVLWLRQVFAEQPDFTGGDSERNRRRLKNLLRAVLVKNEQDRAVFERLCDTWLQRAEQELQARLRPASSLVPPPVIAVPPVKRFRRGWLIGGLAVCLLALVLSRDRIPPPAPPSPPVKKELAKPPPVSQPVSRQDMRLKRITTALPTFTMDVPPAHWTGWPALELGGLALLTGASLWLTLGRRRRVPKFAPQSTRPGPPRIFLQPPLLAGPQLLDARQQEILVWGIGRFVADEPGPRLDLPATVAATARQGGMLTVRYQRASYQREVWLWVDEAADDSAIVRLADEIETTLKLHGLTVERATFRGIPDRLMTPEGMVFAPHEIDERRELALVAVLTDGRALRRQYAVDDRRARIDALLRSLSHWPQLAFVDFSAPGDTLAWMLARHELERIEPTALAAFLGGDSARAVPPRDWGREDTVWAAACALAPASVDEATALALRQRLGAGVSPWALRALRAEAAGPGGRLQWQPERRTKLLNWLYDAEFHPADGVAADSLLDRALAFWEEQYKEEETRRLANDTFRDTRAHRQLLLEYHLLLLWRQPEQAIDKLYELYQEESWQAPIRRELSGLAPRDSDKHYIRLPWRWRQRKPQEQERLQAMGFGGDLAPVRLRQPGRLWLGLGICLGLALGEFGAALRSPLQAPAGPPMVVHVPQKPGEAGDDRIEATADGRWRVSVHTRKVVKSEETAPGARVQVAWSQGEQPCVEVLDGAELWRCSRVDAAPPAAETRHSLVVLMAQPGDPVVEDLTIDLLTGGDVDRVLIDPNWPRQRQALLGPHERLDAGQQLLVFTAKAAQGAGLLPPGDGASALLRVSDWTRLRQALNFQGVRAVAALGPAVTVVAGDREGCRLRGIGACQPVEETDSNGIAFVRICPGEFMMGSPPDEKDREGNEGPAHKVTVGEFWIGKHETTNEQYRLFHQDWKEKDKLPVANVSWNDAKAFCEQLGYRLPTEAEWEYAARAGTPTRYSFGDDEQQLGDYAWFDQNSNNKIHPVGQKKSNPWGLYDMHGNVWEWVQDCGHDNYQGAPTDGSAWEDDNCQSRVLRGGSFGFRARILRSANRSWDRPVIQDWDVGFRCVRGAGRQP